MAAEDMHYFFQLQNIHTLDIKVAADGHDALLNAFGKLSDDWCKNVKCTNLIFDEEVLYDMNHFLQRFENLTTLRIQHRRKLAIIVEVMIRNLTKLEVLDLHYNEPNKAGIYLNGQIYSWITQNGFYENVAIPTHICIHSLVAPHPNEPNMFFYSKFEDLHPAYSGFRYFIYDYKTEKIRTFGIAPDKISEEIVRIERPQSPDPHLEFVNTYSTSSFRTYN
ncbi:unnamed protein product [Caenorhabditis angaria]|uniref:Uncharacterized protein n=1 Tax=Caenorhabditis angaria TaxID=860376 RepID=A0A9P1N909_9PELO|nr:unnamed protein product [Caenorhabditis angaria]